jgi:hypothetical protein
MRARYQTSSIIETLGGSDIVQIFVHYLAQAAHFESSLPGYEKYPERPLVMAKANDIVCVLNAVDDQYLAFLDNLGIGPKHENIIIASNHDHPHSKNLMEALRNNPDAVSAIGKRIGNHKKIGLNSFTSSEEDLKLVAVLETALHRKISLAKTNLQLVEFTKQKHHARAKAMELGVPVAPGEVVELPTERVSGFNKMESAIRRHIGKTGSLILKGASGFSGSSIFIVRNTSDSIQNALRQIGERLDNDIYVVEVLLDVTVSPNILMHITPDKISFIAITDQLLNSELVHQGNIYPSVAKTLEDMSDSSWKLSKWLQKEGYAGLVGFDFGEYFDVSKGKFEHFLCEINPRTNAAAYPKSLMEHLNRQQAPSIEAFLATNVKTKVRTFSELQRLYGHLFFDPAVRRGLIPYNTGCLEYGKFTVAALGSSRDEVFEIYEDFMTLPPEAS